MIEQLYREHYEDAVRIMRRVLKNDNDAAEDIVQEAFVRVIDKQSLFDPNRGNMKAWFNSIMFNVMRDYKRGLKEENSTQCENISLSSSLEEGSIKEREGINDFIGSEINKVKNLKHRAILTSFFIKGYSLKQISKFQSCTQENVKVVVHRFRRSLDS